MMDEAETPLSDIISSHVTVVRVLLWITGMTFIITNLFSFQASSGLELHSAELNLTISCHGDTREPGLLVC